ncbi:hypothetical protein [Streptomyces lavenduligriseus]|uniref:hypothetical protein n=1 Tax=Streptomyces lavenduligriseus TaxID=67315 RepID=UPI003558A00C
MTRRAVRPADRRTGAAPAFVLADRNRALTGRTAAVLAVCGTPDDRYAVTGDEDGTVRVWDVVTGRCGAGSRQALPSPVQPPRQPGDTHSFRPAPDTGRKQRRRVDLAGAPIIAVKR